MKILLMVAFLSECVAADRCLIARAVERYTVDNADVAELLRHLTPTGRRCPGGCGQDATKDTFYAAVQKLRPVLAKRLKAGDQVAWNVAIGLREFTDGGLLEDISATVAPGVKVQPSAYLRAAKARPRSGALHIVGHLGEDFVDRPLSDRCSELSARLASLAAVSDADLVVIRDQSVRELRRVVQPCK
jgi:hypothetical protein